MTQDSDDPALFERDPLLAQSEREPVVRTALVHVLTPEFHGLDVAEFAHITDEVVARASAEDLEPSLFWLYVRKDRREKPEVSTFSYITPSNDVMTVALTPAEYTKASDSVEKLAQRRSMDVLATRDRKLQEETGDKTARARSKDDMRAANRGAVRAAMQRQADMEELLAEGIMPKIELIDKFNEMSRGRNQNLARGTRESVSQRFEELRTGVFDDMLDAVALQRGWTEEMTEKAKKIIQKRLYVSGTPKERKANFQEMLELAENYFGHKRALILTKIQEAKKYQHDRPEVVADIMAVDEQRLKAKEAKQLRLDEST